MLSFLRAAGPPRTNQASKNPIFFDNGTGSVEFGVPNGSGGYAMVHTLPAGSKAPGGGDSCIKPPLHIHPYQNEHFNVHSGSGLFFLGLDKNPFTTLSANPGGQRRATIPKNRYHRFENASETEPLVLSVDLEPLDAEIEQRFFRNFFGYLDDCRVHKTAPSIFQLMVFLNAADIPLGLPAPNETVGVIISRIFTATMAFIGSWILGYPSNYPEYYEPSKAK